MGEFNVGGLTVEIDGVDRDDLPSAFDFSEMMKLAQEGESVDEMAKYVHAQVWVESDRGQEFWDVYTGKTSTRGEDSTTSHPPNGGRFST
ncbi:hypothetical protein HCTV5_21 [Halovirus HCTV-5]|uniref:hypothetical protein n=1 Tax=Halovirus HCTV-5 TaxID=1273748 RepID=UPI0003348C84|nr:hypothetical protein M200_gp021 [Halovirus HCTV-5]AGM11631.1 hypothetical protein HCTV5_21 [Halovirus HCTV-5]